MSLTRRIGPPILFYLRTMVLVVLAWWAVSLWLHKAYLLPSPLLVANQAIKLVENGKMLSAVLVSAQRLLLTYLAAGLVGVLVGIAMGLSAFVSDLLDWIIEIARPISGIAWIPVLLVVMGVSPLLPAAIIFYAAIFPFILNTASGVRNVDRRYVDAARVLGAGRLRIITRVVLPAALPDIVTGARVAASNSWMALIVSELIGAPNGLGFQVGYAQELGNATLVLAWILFIGVCGYMLDRALETAQARLTPWTSGLKIGE